MTNPNSQLNPENPEHQLAVILPEEDLTEYDSWDGTGDIWEE